MITCNVIEDLLPLYADEICSDDSRTIVEHHVAECNECREKLEAMKTKLVSDSDEKAEIEHSRVFKLFHKRYARLGIITLLICAAILIPSAILGIMYVNEETDQGYSFSSLKMEYELNKFAELMKKGMYRAALDMVIIDNQYDYTEEELSAIKDMYAEDFENYFKKYPLKRVTVGADEGKCTYGIVYFEIETDLVPDNIKIIQGIELDRKNNSWELYLCGANYTYAYDGKKSTDAYDEILVEIRKGFPYLLPISKDLVENYFDRIKEERYDNVSFYFSDEEKKEAVFSGNFERQAEINEENTLLIENLFTDYTYISCDTGEILYMRGEINDTCDRYFSQYTTLNIKNKDDTVFSVSFDLPIVYGHQYYSFQNITYSDNTPEDFKTRFEEIFA